MPRKLNTYETSLGFFDLAVAAPSMKAALEAWGANRNLFHDGVAKQSDDPDVIAAAMAVPGVVLKRPVGSGGRFKEHAPLPPDLADAASEKARPKSATSKKKHAKQPSDRAADRKAAVAFEQEQKRRERENAKQEIARAKERERRQRAVHKAQSALDAARRKHEKNAANIHAELQGLEQKAKVEDIRWEKERARLEATLRQVRG